MHTANRQTQLKLSANPDGSAARTMTVVPAESDVALRRRAWVEANRRRVDELSKGRLAYVHMPDTGRTRAWPSSTATTTRSSTSQGLILDERYNRGGKVADYVIATLAREPDVPLDEPRGLGAPARPSRRCAGPKVMVINEYAGSGGDAMPWLFQRAKIGPARRHAHLGRPRRDLGLSPAHGRRLA